MMCAAYAGNRNAYGRTASDVRTSNSSTQRNTGCSNKKRTPSRIDFHTVSRCVELGAIDFIKSSATTTASVNSAFAAIHGATPNVAITIPAIGGPIAAGILNARLLRPIAVLTNSRGTISGTQL